MGYWGWRPLVFCMFISVLIMSCTSTLTTAPSPTPTPLLAVTLTIRTPITTTPSVTPGLSLETAITQPPPQNDASDGFPRQPTPLPILVSPPDCFLTAEEQWLCFGMVENLQSVSVERVILEITFINQAGVSVYTEQIILPQRVLQPQAIAPYHILVAPDSPLDEIIGVTATLIRAEPLSPQSPTLLLLDTSNIRIERQDQRVIINGTIINNNNDDAENIQIVVMLYDRIGRVVGYRVLMVDRLTSGDAFPFDVVLLSQVESDEVTYTINAIGFASIEDE